MRLQASVSDLWETIAGEASAESGLWAQALLPATERELEPVFSPLGELRFALGLETIYEGYLLHYGAPRVVSAEEADLGLLAGDRLYAIGLARLVALGDTAAVAELADTITLSALAQGAGEQALADAVWAAGARAVGWGSSEEHRRAKHLAFSSAPEALEAMRTSAGVPAVSP